MTAGKFFEQLVRRKGINLLNQEYGIGETLATRCKRENQAEITMQTLKKKSEEAQSTELLYCIRTLQIQNRHTDLL
jgi:hypothetical protein